MGSDNDPIQMVEQYLVKSGVEAQQKHASFAGGLTRRNPWVFCFLCLITLGFYACMRKKRVGGLMVTCRRVVHVVLVLDASNNLIEYEQTSFFVRNFAHETHKYTQPVYTCGDWLCCIPCCDCICFCRKPVPSTDIKLYFFEYPNMSAKVRGANATQFILSCCMCLCKPCTECCIQCARHSSRVKLNRVWLNMEVPMEDGLRNVTNVLAGILYYHPAKYTQRGKPWHHGERHDRILSVNLTEVKDYTLFDRERKVPVDAGTDKVTSTWGLTDGEAVYDGFAGKLRFCTFAVCCLSVFTLGIWWCIMKINYDNCAAIRREYFLLTDRRLIRYTLYTTGAKSVPRLNAGNTSEHAVTEFELEVSSWMLTAFNTYRYSEESSCLACCGHCCCCAKKEYSVNLYTAFGRVHITGEGKNAVGPSRAESKDDHLERFLKNLMFQHSVVPLADALSPSVLGEGGPRLGSNPAKPGDDDDVVLLDAADQYGVPQEHHLVTVVGRPYGNCCARCLCCVPCRIFTLCCCPRDRTKRLYITTQRLITSATVTVPCTGLVLDTFTEYYNLTQIKRMTFNQSYACTCCGACNCCQVSYLAFDTDNDFEESEEGHETYTVEQITGISGTGNNEDKSRMLVAALSIMQAQEEWILKKRVLEHNLAQQMETEVVPADYV